MKDGISQYGRIIIVVLVLLSLIGFIFGGMYLYRIGGFSNTIPDGVEENLVNRAPPTLNVQDQTTLVDKELDIRSIVSAFNVDGEDISDKIKIECENKTVFNEEAGIFKSSEAGKFILLLSVTDTGSVNGQEYTTTSTKKMTILVDNAVGQHTITIVSVSNGVLLTNTRIAKTNTVIKFTPKPDTGYEFNGVDVVCVNDKSLTVVSDLEELVMPDDDIIITPKWTPIKVNVLLNANNGKIDGETIYSKTYGEPYGELPGADTVTKPGYQFVGWGLVRSTSDVITEETIVSTPNAHYLYAQWEQKSYTITFDPTNGEDTFTKSVKYNERIGEIPTPSREGYSFKGWVLETDSDTVINANTKYLFDSDVKVTALWQPRSSFVRLDANGGTVTPKQVKVYFGQTYNSLPQPYRMGYKFVGWFTEKDGGEQIKNTDTVNLTTSLVLYAHWEKETYTITFNATPGVFANGSNMETTTTEYQGIISLPSSNPTDGNKNFLGWYTSSVGGVKISDGDVYNYSSDKTFYAHWSTSKYTINFDANGGTLTSISSIDIAFGSPYGQLPTATRVGHRFLGWYTSPTDDGTLVLSSTIMNQESEHTLYAHWELMEYNISFAYNDEGVTNFPSSRILSVIYGNEIPALEPENYSEYPERTNYVFSHWELANGDSVCAGDIYSFETDIVLYPVWKIASIICVDTLDAATALATISDSDTVTFERKYPVNAAGHYAVYDTNTILGDSEIYTGNDNIVSILPSSNVISIAENAFNACSNLTSININNNTSISSIGKQAFAYCVGLDGHLVLSSNIIELGNAAFDGCSSLDSLDISNIGVTTIPEKAFNNCTSLQNVLIISKNINTIEAYAFRNCPFGGGLSLSTEITSLTIGKEAFRGTMFGTPLDFTKLSNLMTLNIGESAFYSSTISLLKLPEEIEQFSIEKLAFSRSGITNGRDDINPLIIPDYITNIPDQCFSYCESLEVVVLPDTTIEYGSALFAYCNSLREVTLPCNVPMDAGMFNVTNITKLTITPGLTSSDIDSSKTFYSVSDVLNYRVDNSDKVSKKIKGYMELTKGCNSVPWDSTLQTAEIQDGILNLSDYLFANCTQLNRLSIPVDCNIVNGSYEHIDYDAIISSNDRVGCNHYSEFFTDNKCRYSGCGGELVPSITGNSLAVYLGLNYTYDTNTFTNVSNLSTLILTKGIGSNSSLYEASQYTSFTAKLPYVYNPITIQHSPLGDLIPWIETDTLTTLIIKPGVVNLPERIFSGAEGLTNVTMPCNLTPRASSFAGCTGVSNVYITTGLDYDNNLITSCYNYGLILNDESSVSYDDSPWYDSINAINFYINDGVTTLGDNMFNKSAILNSLTDTYSIKSIEFASSVTTIGEKTFQDATFNDAIITVPSGLNFNSGTLQSSAYNGSISKVIVIESDTDIAVDYNESNYTKLPWNALCPSTSNLSFSIVISDGVTYIPAYYFYNSNIAGTITIPESVTYIGDNAFGGSTLTSIAFNDGTTAIPDNAFYNCANLQSVTASNTITSIGSNAFYGCVNLSEILIPESVNSIGAGAFANCSALTEIVLPETLTLIENETFNGCAGITSITLPDAIAEIGEKAFYNCTNLNTITVSDNVAIVEANAFQNTAYYNDTNNWENDVLYVGNHLIEAKTTIVDTYAIKDGTKTIASYAFNGCATLTNITIPDSLVTIGAYAFSDCSALKEFIIPNGVTLIKDNAFNNCSAIEKMIIGDGITSIDNFNFPGLALLKEVTIGSGVKSIGSNIFAQCPELTNVTIGENVTSIGDLAFATCPNLENITIPANVAHIGEGVFFSSGLNAINVSENNNNYCSIDGVLFNKDKTVLIAYPINKSDTSYTIPEGVTTIDSYAFATSTSLVTVIIPDSVMSIGDYAFGSCTSLTTANVPDGAVVGENAFYGCPLSTT